MQGKIFEIKLKFSLKSSSKKQQIKKDMLPKIEIRRKNIHDLNT